MLIEARADKGQAAGNQHRAAHSLYTSGDDELPDISRQPAPRRRGAEQNHAQSENVAPSVAIAQRPPISSNAAREQRVGFHHPLNVRKRGIEAV